MTLNSFEASKNDQVTANTWHILDNFDFELRKMGLRADATGSLKSVN